MSNETSDDRSDEPDDGPDDEPTSTTEEPAGTTTPERTVTRRVVTSRRVTPKGGAAAAPASSSKARDAKKTETVVHKAVTAPQQQTYPKGPSPWWVPTLMFALLIVGALVIMANYMGVFGQPDNIRLVIGLALILGGIVTATQYR